MEGTTRPIFYMLFFFILALILVLLFVKDAVNKKKTIDDVFNRENNLMRSVNEKLILLTVDTAGIVASLASIDKSLKKIAFDEPRLRDGNTE